MPYDRRQAAVPSSTGAAARDAAKLNINKMAATVRLSVNIVMMLEQKGSRY